MALLSNTRKNEDLGVTNHQYAKMYGWRVEVYISPRLYKEAHDCFENIVQLEEVLEDHAIRVIRFRRSWLGRLLKVFYR